MCMMFAAHPHEGDNEGADYGDDLSEQYFRYISETCPPRVVKKEVEKESFISLLNVDFPVWGWK